MDMLLFSSLLCNLLKTNVNEIEPTEEILAAFEKEYCLDPNLQPMFTAPVLSMLISAAQEYTLYEVMDPLGVGLSFFCLESHTFFIGPYLAQEFDELYLRNLLAKLNVPASVLLTVKLFRSSLSRLHTSLIQDTAGAVIHSFLPDYPDFSCRQLRGLPQGSPDSSEIRSESYVQEVYSRYELENRWMAAITAGDKDQLRAAFRYMDSHMVKNDSFFAFRTYQNPLVTGAIVRALGRKAAERGGLSVITIDEITQRYSHRLENTRTVSEGNLLMYAVLEELADAVKNARNDYAHFSPKIKLAAEFISLEYSNEIRIDDLCERTGLSASHLSREFRKETGRTIPNFIAEVRCRHAADLLRQTDLAIGEISSHVGYTDNNYFVKVFKKQYGRTPGAYRRENS